MASARAVVEAIEPGSELADGLKRSMSETLDLIESAHRQIDATEATCEALWHHFDGLRAHHLRCRGLLQLGGDIAEVEIAAALSKP